jgi:hypothetical protein
VDGLQTEVSALKALVITSTPAKPNRHPHHHQQLEGRGSPACSAPGSPAKERPAGAEGEEEEGGSSNGQEARFIDPVLRQVGDILDKFFK